ncbi:MAG: superinfection immunity protein [Gemmatimonadaceae bacterium]|jgi:multisubunit Na+/H+ antiporter MnhB subunit|nr:superinfection immunity protein [Gemmatimonadaceae bacterium]
MNVLLLLQAVDPAGRYTGGGLPKGAVIIVALVLLYFLPSMLAWSRKSQRRWKITAINALLGWTVIGWIVSMVMTWAYEPPPEGETDTLRHR